jgi:F-type H+-transporting ATPase subunit delta
MKTTKQTKREAVRLFRLCLVNGVLDEGRARQVVERVIDAKRRGGLALLAYFQRLVKLEIARHTAEVVSAMPLSPDLHDSIRAGLARVHGPGIRVFFVHNPRLIGGIRIKVGSDVYDGSVRARLVALEKSF